MSPVFNIMSVIFNFMYEYDNGKMPINHAINVEATARPSHLCLSEKCSWYQLDSRTVCPRDILLMAIQKENLKPVTSVN